MASRPKSDAEAALAGVMEAPNERERVFDAFRRVLIDRCLVHGGYFSDEGLEMLVSGSVARMEAAPPGAVQVRASVAKPEIRSAIGRAAPAGG